MSTLPLAFLGVSAISVAIQAVAWIRMLRAPGSWERHRIARTVASRMAAALAYLSFGITTLVAPELSPVIGFGLFTLVQGLWWANSLADTRREPLAQRDLDLEEWVTGLRPAPPEDITTGPADPRCPPPSDSR